VLFFIDLFTLQYKTIITVNTRISYNQLIAPHIEIALLIMRNQYSVRLNNELCKWNGTTEGFQESIDLVAAESVVEG
jgi:hypothetical protein